MKSRSVSRSPPCDDLDPVVEGFQTGQKPKALVGEIFNSHQRDFYFHVPTGSEDLGSEYAVFRGFQELLVHVAVDAPWWTPAVMETVELKKKSLGELETHQF